MIRNPAFIILAIALIVTALAVLLPGGRQADSQPKLPWQIESLADGSVRVFSLTLGKSTLNDAKQLLSADPTLSLFRSPEGALAIEAYFQRASLSGLRADFIMALDIDQATAEQMFERGLRISQLGSGGKKVELSATDNSLALESIIRNITYIPGTDLETELLLSRFGEPEQRITDTANAEHWLYPAKGLGIIVNPESNEVFQYLHPADFDQLIQPLLEAQSKAQAETETQTQ
ncbi:MAG: hypothetical protein V7707_14690 [Motiliproteus sp.]